MNLKTLLFAGALLAVAATPSVAQQLPALAPPPVSAETPASAPAAPLAGPRVRPEFRQVEARLTSDPEPMTYKKSSETITVSTLVLVLLVVILVLLIT